jgi:hypothetical protein
MKKTVQIPVSEMGKSLRNGGPDLELMEKYGLSEKGLETTFDRLLRAMSTWADHIDVEDPSS